MKISKSKQELARIISENGGWGEGEFAAQDKDGDVFKFYSKPVMGASREVWIPTSNGAYKLCCCATIKGWNQTILSREEYFHLYPAPSADGWIEWNGGKCPVGIEERIDVKFSDGDELFNVDSAWDWGDDAAGCGIIAYRHHKTEQANHEFCDSVMRSITGQEVKKTIEQLAAYYRNAKDYAERKQQEADEAKEDADAKLKALELAGEAIGLIVSPITGNKELELVITDWRDLQLGDEVEAKCHAGVVAGFVTELEPHEYDGERPFRFKPIGESARWCTSDKFRFIRRP